MDYTDAHMERGAARQELLEGLKRKVMTLEEEDGRLRTCAFLSETIVQHLADKEGQVFAGYPDSPASNLFFEELHPAIKGFARTEEEENALVASLLDWIIQSFTSHFAGKLLSQENHQPELLFTGDDRQEKML